MRRPYPTAELSRRRFLSWAGFWAGAGLGLFKVIALPAPAARADTASLRAGSAQITADDDTLTL